MLKLIFDSTFKYFDRTVILFVPREKVNNPTVPVADVLPFGEAGYTIRHIYGKSRFGISLMMAFQFTVIPRFVKLIDIAAVCFKFLLSLGSPVRILTLHYRVEFKYRVGFTILECRTLTPLTGDCRKFVDIICRRFGHIY